MIERAAAHETRFWSVVATAISLPLLVTVCTMLWRVPFPLSESVVTFDVSAGPAASFLDPSLSYYRPLFFTAISLVWHAADSVDGALAAVRLFHIVPVALLVVLLIWHVRPRTALDAAAAAVAVTVLVGSPGFIDNLELPLSYTIVGMAAALIVWVLLERDYRVWHGAAVVILTLVAIGFKEQGLVLVPLVVAAWCSGAPGVGRATVAAVVVVGVAYVAFRLILHNPALPLFEQDVGLGFARLSPEEAESRFGGFPLWIYAYSAASTMSNVLFAEPSGGVFRITRALTDGEAAPWHFVHLFSSLSSTALIVWWGAGSLRLTARRPWPQGARLFIVFIAVLAASGALSFNYSRDRLGGMAVVFYALAAYFAVRAAANQAMHARRSVAVVAAAALLMIAGCWQLRALYAVEFHRDRAVKAQREWMTALYGRRAGFADRPGYLRIMADMKDQGTNPERIQYTPYPQWMMRTLGGFE